MRKRVPIVILFFLFHNSFAQNKAQQGVNICEAFVGYSLNSMSSVSGNKTNLWYDKDIDALAFVFAYDTSNIGYALSTDHGLSWTLDTMLYQAPSLTYNGRLPQGLIYNPPGNTNPANAYVTCFGSTTDGANWNAFYEGTTLMGSGANQQTLFPFSSTLKTTPPQGGTIVKNTGTTWWSAAGNSISNIYNDTIVLAKGTFGGNNFVYNYTYVPVPVCTDNNSTKMFRNQAIIFDDSGQFGYLVVIGNDWVCNIEPYDSTIGLIVYTTIDSGNTWSKIPSPDIQVVDTNLQNNGSRYCIGTQLDLAIDQQGTLHIGVAVIPFNTGNVIDSFYVNSDWGLFDFNFYPVNNVWNACLITRPMTYYGEYGIIGDPINPYVAEENRLQISRSWDGDKIFYTWFDTDTLIFTSASGNIFSDMYMLGTDITTGLWTSTENLTQFSGTMFDGASSFGNASYYTLNNGNDEEIPVTLSVLVSHPISTGLPTQFYYAGCVSLNSPFNNSSNCLLINVLLGVRKEDQNSIANNYPNPFTGKTFVDVTLDKITDVTIVITNTIGQVCSSTTYKNLHSGKNTLSIEGSDLNQGLYIYTVIAGNDVFTKMMSVE